MKVEDFFKRIEPDVPDCPRETMRQAVVDAIDELCDKANVWNLIQDAIPLLEGITDYSLDVVSGAVAISLTEIWCGTRKLIPLTMPQLQIQMPDWATAQGNEPIYYNAAFDLSSVKVFPIPTNVTPGATLTLRGVFRPVESTTFVPDFFGERYRVAVVAGAKSVLMQSVGKVYSNPAMAVVNKAAFDLALNDARIFQIHERTKGSISVLPRPFGF